MKIGVSSSCYYPLETELALKKIGESGIDTAEIFFNCQSELKEGFVDMLCDIKNHYGINIASLHPTMSLAESFMMFSAYERRFYEGLDSYRRYSEIAARLNAKYIIMHGGKPNGVLSDEEYCERYMLIKDAALQNGVTVLQENVTNFRAGDIEFLRSMVDILGNNAELCMDIKQTIRSGINPLELYNEFKQNIKHFHISDHSLASDCLLPLNGKFDFNGFFGLLRQNNFSGTCIIEVYENAYKEFSEITKSYLGIKKL